jgi:hypothetical protein
MPKAGFANIPVVPGSFEFHQNSPFVHWPEIGKWIVATLR